MIKALRVTVNINVLAGSCIIYARMSGVVAGEEVRAFIIENSGAFDVVLAQSAVRSDIASVAGAEAWHAFSGDTLAAFAPTAGTTFLVAIASMNAAGALIAQDDDVLTHEPYAGAAFITDVTPLTWGAPSGLTADGIRDYCLYLMCAELVDPLTIVRRAEGAVPRQQRFRR